MTRILLAWLAAALTLGAVDVAWLVTVANDLYRAELGTLMAPDIRPLPALVWYLGYPAGILFLALTPRPATRGAALLRACALGAVAYGTYDFTNLATLQGWSAKVSLIDVMWGTFATGLAGLAADAVLRR